MVVDLQNTGDPRYDIGMEFIDMYKDAIGLLSRSRTFKDVITCMQCRSLQANQYVETKFDPL